MNKIFIIFCLIVFQSNTLAQTVDPDYIYRYDHQQTKNGIYRMAKQYITLPWDFYPWGVCLKKATTLTENEKNYVREAMAMWNKRYSSHMYIEYIDKIPPNQLVGYDSCGRLLIKKFFFAGVPSINSQNPLFIESCDKKSHNIIYFKKVAFPKQNDIILGRWSTIFVDKYFIFPDWSWRSEFYGLIEIQKLQVWKSTDHITNTLLHELGHALGLSHDLPHLTQFMNSRGDTPMCKKKKMVCKILQDDIIEFLKPYTPYISSFIEVQQRDRYGNLAKAQGLCR